MALLSNKQSVELFPYAEYRRYVELLALDSRMHIPSETAARWCAARLMTWPRLAAAIEDDDALRQDLAEHARGYLARVGADPIGIVLNPDSETEPFRITLQADGIPLAHLVGEEWASDLLSCESIAMDRARWSISDMIADAVIAWAKRRDDAAYLAKLALMVAQSQRGLTAEDADNIALYAARLFCARDVVPPRLAERLAA